MSDRLEGALELAERGLLVFPLKNGTKDGQLLRSWKNEATTAHDTIREWWTKWPDAEVAIACGSDSGVVVVDVDAKNGGLDSLAHLDVPETTRVRTPSGGLHFYFAHPGERVKTLRHPHGPAPGIDVRGDGKDGSGVGGYVLAPPSTGYAWEIEDEIAALPSWVTEPSADDPLAPERPKGSRRAGSGRRDRVMRAIVSAMHAGDTPEEALAKGDALAATIAPDRDWLISLDALAGWAREQGIGDPLARSLGDVLGRSDAIIAEGFANEYGNKFRWCPELRCAFTWNGAAWELDVGETRLEQALTDYGFSLARRAGEPQNRKHMKELQDHSRRILGNDAGFTSVLKFVKRHRAFCTSAEDFDTHPNLLTVRNGVLDLDHEVEPGVALLREHRPEDMLTLSLDLDYVPGAPWDRVEAALADWHPAEGEAEFLLRYFSQGLAGRASVEALFAIGYTANAKSIAADLVRDVLGPFVWEGNFSTFNRKIEASGPRSDLVRMRGARFGIIAEGEQGRALDAAVFKKLTGGGEPIPVAEKHKPEWVLQPTATLWFHTNHMPELSGADGGVMRRVLVQPWDVRFYKPDTEADLIEQLRAQGDEPKIARDRVELLTELKSQREGFFAALVAAYFETQRNGLAVPGRVIEATREWSATVDALSTFLELKTERSGPDDYIVKDNLVREFNEWAHEVGASRMDSTGMTVALKGLGYKDDRRRNPESGERERRFAGIRWKALY